jgi:hypothetical protein
MEMVANNSQELYLTQYIKSAHFLISSKTPLGRTIKEIKDTTTRIQPLLIDRLTASLSFNPSPNFVYYILMAPIIKMNFIFVRRAHDAAV